MHVGHLPVGDIHLLVIPQGQWKCDSISSSKDSWDVGLHHLQGATEVDMGGVCTLHGQKLQSWSGPELPWSPRTQGKPQLGCGAPRGDFIQSSSLSNENTQAGTHGIPWTVGYPVKRHMGWCPGAPVRSLGFVGVCR